MERRALRGEGLRIAERPALMVAIVVASLPLTLLAWRCAMRRAFPIQAQGVNLALPYQVLPFMVIPMTILIWVVLQRLRHGLPSRRRIVPVLVVQLAATAPAAEFLGPATTLPLVFACTVLVMLPNPWSWLGFLVTAATDLTTDWVLPLPALGGMLLHSLLTGMAVYTLVRLGELAIAFRRAQAQLAVFAVVQERMRVSRDLHDTLGQELTAIGLRAELAVRLVGTDQSRAVGEMRGVQQMTEQTLGDVRRVARGEWQPVFEDELTTGTALLAAAGVPSRVSVVAEPDARIERAVGWALREGIMNVLKHSTARKCSISTEIRDGHFRLTVENDGVQRQCGAAGTGLAGITQRVGELGGRVRFGPLPAGRFRLVVEISTGGER